MAWHHIIPFSLLREVWNRLVDQHIATELAEARVAIRKYPLLSDRNQTSVDSLIDRMRAENTGHKRAGHHHLCNPLASSKLTNWMQWLSGPRGTP